MLITFRSYSHVLHAVGNIKEKNPKYQTTQEIPFHLRKKKKKPPFMPFILQYTAVEQSDITIHDPVSHTRKLVCSFIWSKVSFKEVFPFSIN